MANEINMIEVGHKDFSKQNFWKRNGINLMYSLIIALFIVLICTLSDKNFFFYDDAQTEALPYLRQSGKIWLKGEIPFIIKSTFIGQNLMIDLNRPIFLPQNIIMSIISVKVQSLTTIANIFAFFNTVLLSFFAFKLCESLSLNKIFKIVFAFLISINPIYLYFYLSSWWSYASGYAWFIAGLSSIFLLRKNFSRKYLIVYIFTVYNLFATGIPQVVLTYLLCIVVFIWEIIYYKEYKKLIIFVLINLGLLLIVLNIYSEYIITRYMLNRSDGFSNTENFLLPSLNSIIMTFNPVYYDWLHRWGGYLITYLPLGYSSIYILFLICFKDKSSKLFKNKNIRFLFILNIIFLVLSQTPTHMGPTHLPLRYMQFLSAGITLFSIYALSISKLCFTKIRIKIFVSVLFLSSLLSLFKLENNHLKVAFANIIFIMITIYYLYSLYKNRYFKLIPSMTYSILIFFLMLFIQSSTNGILSFPGLQDKIKVDNDFSKNGYILSLTNGRDPKENIEDLASAHFLIYDMKSINGDDPIGNKYIGKTLETVGSQGMFKQEPTINNLSARYRGICYFDLMNITSIPIWKDMINENMKQKLEECGYFPREVRSNLHVVYYLKDKKILGNISYVSDGININKVLEDRNNVEKYSISSSSEGIIILSKVWWRGYRAYVNGKRINISNLNGLVKLDNIPSGLNNSVLELKYFPASWKITLWLGLIGIIEIILVLRYFKERKDKVIEKTDSGNI